MHAVAVPGPHSDSPLASSCTEPLQAVEVEVTKAEVLAASLGECSSQSAASATGTSTGTAHTGSMSAATAPVGFEGAAAAPHEAEALGPAPHPTHFTQQRVGFPYPDSAVGAAALGPVSAVAAVTAAATVGPACLEDLASDLSTLQSKDSRIPPPAGSEEVAGNAVVAPAPHAATDAALGAADDAATGTALGTADAVGCSSSGGGPFAGVPPHLITTNNTAPNNITPAGHVFYYSWPRLKNASLRPEFLEVREK